MWQITTCLQPLLALPLIGGSAVPPLLRKHQISISPDGHQTSDDHPHRGHKYEPLLTFQSALEEMQAIHKAAEKAKAKTPEDDVQQSLDEDCAASGDACKKVVDFLADRVPVAKEDKLDYLCTSQALTCLSAHMDKCRSAHERVVQMQGEWQCEAVTCSQAGGDCSMTVLFLEMDDRKLTNEQRHRKTQFLCSNEAKKCVSEHKDICKTTFDIVSVAKELGHCDRARCAEAGVDCSAAVSYLSEDRISNVTYKDSHEKWTYLCGDAPFQCLEKNLDVCTRYYNSLKLAFAEGHCDSAQCAKEGPDCATAVNYLADPDKKYFGEELTKKTDFLCGEKGIGCIMSHSTCAEFQKAAKMAYESSLCPEGKELPEVVQMSPKIKQEVNAKRDAELALAKQKAKEKEEKEKKILKKAKEKEGEVSQEGPAGNGTSTKEGKGMTAEEKEKAGKKIFAGLVAAIVALVGFVIWRRKSSPPSSAGTDGGGATSPKSGKPPPPKRDFLTRVKKPLTEAATALDASGSALVARLKAFSGFGIFKKAEGDDKEAPKSTEAAPSTEPPKESDPKDSKEEPPAPPTPAPQVPGAGSEEPREY